ncbi:unnamed protein product [Lathyrus oleraceus]
MSQIVKFIYPLIVVLSLYFVVTNAIKGDRGGRRRIFYPFPCKYNWDCYNKACHVPLRPRCISSNCECMEVE